MTSQSRLKSMFVMTATVLLVHCSHRGRGGLGDLFSKRSESSSQHGRNTHDESVDSIKGFANQSMCQKLLKKIKRTTKTYLRQYKHLNLKNPRLIKIMKLNSSDCLSSKRRDVYTKIFSWLNYNNKKIGIILPMSGRFSQLGKAVYHGMKSVCDKSSLVCNRKLIVKDNRGTKAGTQKAAAEIMLEENVALIIGGLHFENARILAKHAQQAMTPTLLLTRESGSMAASKFASQFYPLDQLLSKSLAKEIAKRKIDSVSILQPRDGGSDKICLRLKEELEAQDIDVHMVPYQSGDFNSMDLAIMKISGTNPVDRSEEFRRLYYNARARAKRNKQRFNPRSVVLEAEPISQAVFIPDNFRIVRHFVNLLKYHGVEKMVLFGNNEWRARSLIKPWDHFLEGAFFADFVGNYKKLPINAEEFIDQSQYFVHPSAIVNIDHQLIGFRAMELASETLSTPRLKKRHIMRKIRDNSDYFTKRTVNQTSNHEVRWPTYLFKLKDRDISLLSPPRQ